MGISSQMDVQRGAAVVLALELEDQHQLLIIAGRRLLRRRRRRVPRWWDRPWLTQARRLEYGRYNRLLQDLRLEDEHAFINYVRLPPHMFDELLNRISPVIQKRDNHMTPALNAGMNLAMTLRQLATGDRYHTLQYDFRCGYSTVVWSVQEVCQAIIQELKDDVMPLPRTQEDWKAIAQQFQNRWKCSSCPEGLG